VIRRGTVGKQTPFIMTSKMKLLSLWLHG